LNEQTRGEKNLKKLIYVYASEALAHEELSITYFLHFIVGFYASVFNLNSVAVW
jgi:hypothetical protein